MSRYRVLTSLEARYEKWLGSDRTEARCALFDTTVVLLQRYRLFK